MSFLAATLASYLLGDDDVEGAKEMLKPLSGVTRLHSLGDGPIFVHSGPCANAGKMSTKQLADSLELALKMQPDFEAAEEMLEPSEGDYEQRDSGSLIVS